MEEFWFFWNYLFSLHAKTSFFAFILLFLWKIIRKNDKEEGKIKANLTLPALNFCRRIRVEWKFNLLFFYALCFVCLFPMYYLWENMGIERYNTLLPTDSLVLSFCLPFFKVALFYRFLPILLGIRFPLHVTFLYSLQVHCLFPFVRFTFVYVPLFRLFHAKRHINTEKVAWNLNASKRE